MALLIRRKKTTETPPLQLADEAFGLVRSTPFSELCFYFIGALPFWTGLITFWATMRYSAYAAESLSTGALMLALLYLWMKVWQARFCQLLMARVQNTEASPWGPRAFFRSMSLQSLQVSGFPALAFSFLVLPVFGWVHAFYQNLSVLDDGGSYTARQLLRESAEQAQWAPRQNHVVIWMLSPMLMLLAVIVAMVIFPIIEATSGEFMATLLGVYIALIYLVVIILSPFSIIIAGNLAMGIAFLFYMLRVLFDVHTVFTTAPGTVQNSTFILVIFALTYMMLDPILKAAYVLRCFESKSRKTGQDLLVALQRGQKRVLKSAGLLLLVGAMLLGVHGTICAQEAEGIAPESLDVALNQELEKDAYAWNMPRAREESELGPIGQALVDIQVRGAEFIGDVIEFFKGFLPDPNRSGGGTGGGAFSNGLVAFGPVAKYLLILLAGLLVGYLVYLIWKSWRERPLIPSGLSAAMPLEIPDLEDENTSAEDLPEEGWLKLAAEMLDKGEWRLGVRALFLATLSALSTRQHIRLARYKSNREYLGELKRREHVNAAMPAQFQESVQLFEAVWYGEHEISREGVMQLKYNQRHLAGTAEGDKA